MHSAYATSPFIAPSTCAADANIPALTVFATVGLSLLIVVIASFGICVGYLSHTGHLVPLLTLGDRYGVVSASLWAPSARWPALSRLWERPVEAGAASLSIAFVSVLESLISGKLADPLTHTNMDGRREVRRLSVGNFVAGLGGGVPATAALARTCSWLTLWTPPSLSCAVPSSAFSSRPSEESSNSPPYQAEVRSKVALYRVVGSLDYLSAAQSGPLSLHILLCFRPC